MTFESHLQDLPDDAPWDEKPGESEIEQGDTDRIPEVDVTEEDLLDSRDNPENWLLYGNDYQDRRHATADVITPENVDQLELEWEIQIGNEPNDFQGPPIVVDGDPPIMYQTIGPDMLYAIDARTGDVLWTHFYRPVVGASDESPPAERGVGILGDTVYKSTLDLGVLAVDRYTGEEEWYYNGAAAYRGETADTEENMHEELMWERSRGTTSSWPPLIYDGTLMKGSFGGEFGVSGFFDAIDVESGEPQWRINMTPEHEWVGDSWMHGGSTAWAAGAIDPDAGNVVIPSSNPGPWYGTVRPGYNPYSTGKVAADVASGEYEWHFQDSPHDWWDYDSSSPPMVIEAEVEGENRRFATWAGKTGWVYTVDADNGRLHQRSDEVVQHLNTFSLPPQNDLEGAPWIMPELTGGTNCQASAYDPHTRTLVVKGTNRPMKFSWFELEYEAGQEYSGMDSIRAEPGGGEGAEDEHTQDDEEATDDGANATNATDGGMGNATNESDEGTSNVTNATDAIGNATNTTDSVGNATNATGDGTGNETAEQEREEREGEENGEEEEGEEEGEDVDAGLVPPEEWNQQLGVIAGIDPITGDAKWRNWFGHDVGRVWGGSMTTATGVTFAGNPRGELIAYDTETGDELTVLEVGDHGIDGHPVSWYDPQEGKQYVAIPGGGGWEAQAGEGNTVAVYSLSE